MSWVIWFNQCHYHNLMYIHSLLSFDLHYFSELFTGLPIYRFSSLKYLTNCCHINLRKAQSDSPAEKFTRISQKPQNKAHNPLLVSKVPEWSKLSFRLTFQTEENHFHFHLTFKPEWIIYYYNYSFGGPQYFFHLLPLFTTIDSTRIPHPTHTFKI